MLLWKEIFFSCETVSNNPENWTSLSTAGSSIYLDTHLFYFTLFVKEQFILNLIPSFSLGRIES